MAAIMILAPFLLTLGLVGVLFECTPAKRLIDKLVDYLYERMYWK